MRSKLTMTRRGEIVVLPALLTEHQCGTLGNTRFNYELTLEAAMRCDFCDPHRGWESTSLDSNHFLINNGAIPAYFARRYQDPEGIAVRSCETMAEEAAYFFWVLFNSPNPADRLGYAAYLNHPLTAKLLNVPITPRNGVELARVTASIIGTGETRFDFTLTE